MQTLSSIVPLWELLLVTANLFFSSYVGPWGNNSDYDDEIKYTVTEAALP